MAVPYHKHTESIMKIRSITLIAAAVLFMVMNSGCGESQATAEQRTQAPSPAVGVYTVKSEMVQLTAEFPGRTGAYRVAEVRPQVEGIILRRLFEEGAVVEEGQKLYEIDSAKYRAAYDKALALADNTGRTARRQESLKDRQSLSAQDYENALYAWQQAQADAELARLDLEYCRITAPITGRIGRSNITEGALVTSGQAQALAVIQQIDPIFVDLNPAVTKILKADQNRPGEEMAEAYYQGAEVILTLADGSQYPLPGAIKFLDSSVEEGTGTVTLRAEFPNPQGKLLPGMFVRAQVVEKEIPDGKLIPQQALFRDQKGQAQVWKVGADDVVEKVNVEVDRTIGNAWLVTAGLDDGDRVVTEGLQKMAQGLQVSPKASELVEIQLAFYK